MRPSVSPAREIDVAFLVFVERYASDLLKWDILAFFARHPDQAITAEALSAAIGRGFHTVHPALGDLALEGVLRRFEDGDQVLFRLTDDPDLRNIAGKLVGRVASFGRASGQS